LPVRPRLYVMRLHRCRERIDDPLKKRSAAAKLHAYAVLSCDVRRLYREEAAVRKVVVEGRCNTARYRAVPARQRQVTSHVRVSRVMLAQWIWCGQPRSAPFYRVRYAHAQITINPTGEGQREPEVEKALCGMASGRHDDEGAASSPVGAAGLPAQAHL